MKAKKTKGAGKVTFRKISGNKKIKVSKSGKATVSSKLKKGRTYKIKVKATSAKTKNYQSVAKTQKITIKIK